MPPDDLPAKAALERRDSSVHPIIWDKPGAKLGGFDLLILRSCWDYHLRAREFAGWLESIRRAGVRLANSPETALWNMSKTYLRSLSEKGVLIAPTVWIEQGSEANLAAILSEQGWEKAIVKPEISATAFQTWLTSPIEASAQQSAFGELCERSGVILQSFVSEVESEGELSLIFFNKSYSHSVLKQAMRGDFRVQEAFGGMAREFTPRPAIIAEARKILALIAEPLLYARVDVVERDGRLVLMELELIEPSLSFRECPTAAERFADALITFLET